MSHQPYIKPPEPKWSIADELRHLITMLRAVALQAGAVRRRCKGTVAGRIGWLSDALENGAKSLVHAVVSSGKLGAAEDYFDNESALYWECLNEVRKCPDRRNALALLYALNADLVLSHETGEPVNANTFIEPVS
jgi:hypothetical protein